MIPTALALRLAPDAFNKVPIAIEGQILDAHSFREREEAETNFDFKQVIPYIVVTNDGFYDAAKQRITPSDTLYLVSQRTSQQQEKRLHNKFSLGQGGHINELDFAGGGSPIANGLRREIEEEFKLHTILDFAPIGIINDNSNDVGKVHLGLIYQLRTGNLAFEVAEKGKHTAGWQGKEGLETLYDKMENWSKIVMDHVIRAP